MSAVYGALLHEGDRYLAEAQGHLDGPSKNPAMATAHAALASAFYARASLEKPDIGAAIMSAAAAAKAAERNNTSAPEPQPPLDDPVVTSMHAHPAGKKRAPRKAATGGAR